MSEHFFKYQRLSGGRSRGRGGVRGGAIRDIVTHSGPAIVAALASNSGFLRHFARANPPFAGTAIYNSLRMAARRRVATRVRLRGRRRFNRSRRWKTRGRFTRRRRVCRTKRFTRVSSEFDGSSAKTTGYINILSPQGGIWKFKCMPNMIPKVQKAIGSEWTHFKIVRVSATYVPETRCCPTLDEVAKNINRSLPSCFKSYHMGTVMPINVKGLSSSQGVIPMDPQKQHKFVWSPKYLRQSSTGGLWNLKPKNVWIPFSENISSLEMINGPIIAWSSYCLPSDPNPAKPTQSLRFKWIVKFHCIAAKFSTFTDNTVKTNFGDNFVKHKSVYYVAGVSMDPSSTVTIHDIKD